jgi:hypothetical protein
MSYDLGLHDPVTGNRLEADAPHQMRGGTYALGGTKDLWLNCTYNYGKHFYRVFPQTDELIGGEAKGIRWLYGKTGAEAIPVLEKAIADVGDDGDESTDYWDATTNNVKRALHSLLAMSRLRPDGVWQGD